jgi:hypothetical protein
MTALTWELRNAVGVLDRRALPWWVREYMRRFIRTTGTTFVGITQLRGEEDGFPICTMSSQVRYWALPSCLSRSIALFALLIAQEIPEPDARTSGLPDSRPPVMLAFQRIQETERARALNIVC